MTRDGQKNKQTKQTHVQWMWMVQLMQTTAALNTYEKLAERTYSLNQLTVFLCAISDTNYNNDDNNISSVQKKANKDMVTRPENNCHKRMHMCV